MLAGMNGPERHLAIAMERAWPLLGRLVAGVAAMLGLEGATGPDRIPRFLHRRALRLIRPAEALARRLIVLMARDMAVPAGPRLSAVPDRDRPRRRAAEQAPAGAPRFQLFEPLPTLAGLMRERRAGPAGPGPRILCLDQPYPVAPVAEPGMAAGPLIARLKALEAVLANPVKRARRHAVFLARKRRSNAPPGRINPIRPGPAPGARSRHTPPELLDLLVYMANEARTAPPGPPP